MSESRRSHGPVLVSARAQRRLSVPRHRKGTPPRARIKGLISQYEFLVSIRSHSARRWGPCHVARFRKLIRVLRRIWKGPISVLNHILPFVSLLSEAERPSMSAMGHLRRSRRCPGRSGQPSATDLKAHRWSGLLGFVRWLRPGVMLSRGAWLCLNAKRPTGSQFRPEIKV